MVLLLSLASGAAIAQQATGQSAPAPAAAATSPQATLTPAVAAPQAAQPASAANPGAAAAEHKNDPNLEADSMIRDEPMDDLQDVYQRTSVTNLSKLYWALGMLDLKDDQAIEDFLKINDCDLYQKYVHNDFEWAKIKQATRKMLGKTMALFPTRYEIIIPINLGAYDQEKSQFLVAPDSTMNNAKRMDVSPNYGVWICGSGDDMKDYPRNMILTLVRPFTFKVVPASAELAELYINSTQDAVSTLSSRIAMAAYKREAYLRLKVRIIQYVETIDFHGRWRAVVIAAIESYDVFADQERLKLLYSKDLSKEDLHSRHHRRTEDTTDSSVKSNSPGQGGDDETPTDSTTGDNTSEINSSDVTGSAVDPGGMGTSSDVDTDVVTHGPSNQQTPPSTQQQSH